jgi:hypothetical protein
MQDVRKYSINLFTELPNVELSGRDSGAEHRC